MPLKNISSKIKTVAKIALRKFQAPFINYEHENDIVINVINGIRPKIWPGTPLEYKNLMKECWDADPLKRPGAGALDIKMNRINLDCQNMTDELFKSEMNKVEENYTSVGETSVGEMTQTLQQKKNKKVQPY
ncbi:hypothetical protein GLOIN_2v1804242 [Rhizophagus irregularis DAOM 181602=DAOM 197198]|uniref:Serine-threonine/tyrosine-protein kinase catalytic domain-containing protein n=1 Tax=Rhizophagus irregularis (strain DAOM 181602 / DAOM 197198 / MUCL 43194) TaxID=747089 RepID=A0A2P4PK38_RHIID|nr:hypothetical protein GLOIN_2v1804242 [Rhizophagus irregularis DAOM 181602=DAOM 197198]POG65759.1 hypothetical protein GLOIN_2v1804242 [Rhizophagus irregularis DAOM 181602=DAOM 197198]|eukprot:XP_025172625.1 hypothetical protein GLOIN_2v1804242 [Rhizophagus irregularis DAOM 181602=DAOM 197198]